MSADEVGQAEQPAFRRASFCAGGECVEVADHDGMIILRNSTRPNRMLHYPAGDWASFIRRLKADCGPDLGSSPWA
jgi:hypothetical protein